MNKKTKTTSNQLNKNSFFRFFSVLSRVVASLPDKTKRISTLVCLGLIALGIVLSSAAMPPVTEPSEVIQTAADVQATVPATTAPLTDRKSVV